MEIFFGVIIAGIFLYINFLIIKKDIQEKIIPNKYLGYLLFLLPLWYIYGGFYGYFEAVNLTSFILQIGIACIIGFLLFHFGKWGAGDAKYLSILSFYLIFTDILVFFFLTGVIFITDLFFKNCIFWIKICMSKKKIIDTYNNIYKDKVIKLEKKLIYITWYKILFQFIFYITYLLLIFTIIRIFFLYIIEKNINLNLIHSNIFLLGILIFLSLITIIFIIKTNLLYHVINPDKRKNYIIIPILLLILFLEYYYFSDSFYKKIVYIYIYYFPIFVILRIIIGSIKYYIEHEENQVIKINDLREGMIINKKIFPILEKKIDYRISKENIKYLKDKKITEMVIIKESGFGIFIFLGFILNIFILFFMNILNWL